MELGVPVSVGVRVSDEVGVAAGGDGVSVGETVSEGTEVPDGVSVSVSVGVSEGVSVRVSVKVSVGVGVSTWRKAFLHERPELLDEEPFSWASATASAELPPCPSAGPGCNGRTRRGAVGMSKDSNTSPWRALGRSRDLGQDRLKAARRRFEL